MSDTILYFLMTVGMPLVFYYHLFTDSLINITAEDTNGLEKFGDFLLTPTRYLFAGKKAVLVDEEKNLYTLEQCYSYQDDRVWHKTAGSIVVFPFSLAAGSIVKGIAHVPSRKLEKKVKKMDYQQFGLEVVESKDWLDPPKYSRRPGDENLSKASKEALREIARILTRHNIPFWLDCGTCLGAYRYGGMIPWDNDIDIAILQVDFTNVKNALSELDPKKYIVQDWSSRDKPGTFLKVYVRERPDLIDIYHYAIDQEKKELYTIVSNKDCIFLPESWRVRESYAATPVAFEVIFPLKKAWFDGVEVFVPNQTEKFLQSKYGENLSPVKIYSASTGKYEKDLSHPYWKKKFVH